MPDDTDRRHGYQSVDLAPKLESQESQDLSRPLPSQADVNLEDAFGKLFKSSVSGTGEEELLRIASNYSLQITAKQIKCLLYLEHKAKMFEALANATEGPEKVKYLYIFNYLHEFVRRWLELKEHNNSDVFVMRALDSISLRKFINENTLKVNIEK